MAGVSGVAMYGEEFNEVAAGRTIARTLTGFRAQRMRWAAMWL